MRRSHQADLRTRSRAQLPLRKVGREARTIPTSTATRNCINRGKKNRISRSTRHCNQVRSRALTCTKRMPIWAWRHMKMILKTWMIHTTNHILINRIHSSRGWETSRSHRASEDSLRKWTIWACHQPTRRYHSLKNHRKKYTKTTKTIVSVKISRNNLTLNVMHCAQVDLPPANRIKWSARQASRSYQRPLRLMASLPIMHPHNLKSNPLAVKLQ
jgi:hypothetical protein